MEKKILRGIVVVAIAAVAAVNVNFSDSNWKMSTINLFNIEALASGEHPDYRCYPNGNGCFYHEWVPTYYEGPL